MPRKRRITKRRHLGFRWDDLTFIDRASVLAKQLGRYSLSGAPHARDRIQTAADLAAAREENHERLAAEVTTKREADDAAEISRT